MASLSTKRNSPQNSLTEGLVVPPSSATDLIAHDAWVFQVVLCNTTGSAATITVADKQSSPLNLFAAFSVGANTTVTFNFPEGVKMIGGIRWSQGTANAINAEVVGWHA